MRRSGFFTLLFFFLSAALLSSRKKDAEEIGGENFILNSKTAVGHKARRYHHFCQPSIFVASGLASMDGTRDAGRRTRENRCQA